MKFIKNIILFIKKNLYKNNLILSINSPEQVLNKGKNKEEFISNIKINKSKENDIIETLICDGDGLGIQNKINY